MYNYPFFNFPNFKRYPYNFQTSYNNHYNKESIKKSQINNYYKMENLDKNQFNNNAIKINSSKNAQSSEIKYSKKEIFPGFSFLNNFLHQEDRNDNESYFEFFGLKLYNDDLLLLGLIFFLYKEDVKDQYLFFTLILLLLS